jgi:hypothetical protein
MADKIFLGLVEIDPNELFTLANVGHDTRGHAFLSCSKAIAEWMCGGLSSLNE